MTTDRRTTFIADFHIHSKYSYATSKHMDLLALSLWGQFKGIGVMGTGDFTHPLWQQELKKQLKESEEGLFELKPEYQRVVTPQVYETCKGLQRFLLSAEISTIFKRNGRCYRTHSIILAPSFEVVEKISKALGKVGNVMSDGRPILGIDVKDLLKIVLDASPDCMLIPAHIWTPWYGLLGSKSGFDSIEQAFEEMAPHIYAFEKGLSSDFLMNAQLSSLDRFAILCNSDAHSVENLGREANLMHAPLSYDGIMTALRTNDKHSLVAGIEFFPQRGKYFGDGHRACGVYLTPEQTAEHKGICPVCHKPVTVGVLNRVWQLADRMPEQAVSYIRESYSVIPLLDILQHALGVPVGSKKVTAMYQQLLSEVGPEFFILLKAPLDQIEKASLPAVARSIEKLRHGDIVVQPGYDGVYGQVIW